MEAMPKVIHLPPARHHLFLCVGPRVADTLAGDAFFGITIVQGIFSKDDANATPCA